MNNELKKLKTEAQAIRLSQTEKATMRANIFALADASKRAQAARVKTRSPYLFIFHQRFAMVVAALLLIVFTGGGTAFAAQGALPGTPLYPVKIYVNENIQGALAVSPEAKVSFHTAVAETRLKEAETLASQGRLDATTSAEIESNLNEHIAQADTIAASLEESDPALSVEASVSLDSSLQAHGSILARLGSKSSDEATQENSSSIALNLSSRSAHGSEGGAVLAMKAAVMAPQAQTMTLSVSATDTAASGTPAPSNQNARTMSATNATAEVSTQPTGAQKKIALQLQKKASSELSDVKDEFNSAKRYLSATTTAKVEAQLKDLSVRADSGADQIYNQDYVAARATFTAIIHDAVELSAFIDASKTFKKDFVRTFWGNSGQNDQDEYDMGGMSGTGAASSSVSAQSNSSSPVQITVQVSAASSTSASSTKQGSATGVNATVDDHGVHIETHF
ncbi:MAG TPA: DUF5667 domain-containing protein [Candidatus Paceibacterota bacterium]|nr:DUF5667 domain-containing protein [Candidatus Paceibacterota bacterium]